MSIRSADLAEQIAETPWAAWGALVISAAVVLAVAFILVWVFKLVTRRLGARGARGEVFAEMNTRFPKVIFWLIAVTGWKASTVAFFPYDVAPLGEAINYALTLATIAVVGWLVCVIVVFLLEGAQRRQSLASSDPFTARRRSTQLRMVRRLIVAIIVVLTAAAMLLTIDGARTFGASLFASAGIASIVAGLAAQSTLGNLIAGIQLAFSNALKVGDTVEVDGQYGTVEEITLTYVVVQIWDDRRHVLPSTYFTTTPYTNWTRNQTEVTGTVFVEADYTVDVPAVRAELERMLDGMPEWDRRSWGLVVTDATGGVAQLRASITATDADQLWYAQCKVREGLISFIATSRPQELTRSRIAIDPAPDE